MEPTKQYYLNTWPSEESMRGDFSRYTYYRDEDGVIRNIGRHELFADYFAKAHGFVEGAIVCGGSLWLSYLVPIPRLERSDQEFREFKGPDLDSLKIVALTAGELGPYLCFYGFDRTRNRYNEAELHINAIWTSDNRTDIELAESLIRRREILH